MPPTDPGRRSDAMKCGPPGEAGTGGISAAACAAYTSSSATERPSARLRATASVTRM